MSQFQRINPNVTKIGKRKWKLNEPFMGVPVDFETDVASVPRPLWCFIDPAGEAFEAAIIHDYNLLYDESDYKLGCHKEFKDCLIAYNVRIWKAYLAYWFMCIYWFVKGTFK